MIRIVHPGSRIRILTFHPSRIPDPKKGTGSRIRNTEKLIFFSFSNPNPPLQYLNWTLQVKIQIKTETELKVLKRRKLSKLVT